jgi:hypothetical protein
VGLGLLPLSDPLPLTREVVLNTWHCVGAQPFLLMHSCETMAKDQKKQTRVRMTKKKEGQTSQMDASRRSQRLLQSEVTGLN